MQRQEFLSLSSICNLDDCLGGSLIAEIISHAPTDEGWRKSSVRSHYFKSSDVWVPLMFFLLHGLLQQEEEGGRVWDAHPCVLFRSACCSRSKMGGRSVMPTLVFFFAVLAAAGVRWGGGVWCPPLCSFSQCLLQRRKDVQKSRKITAHISLLWNGGPTHQSFKTMGPHLRLSSSIRHNK